VAHPQASQLHAAAQWIADATGARLGYLTEAANTVGGYLAGAAANNAVEVFSVPKKAYLLLNAEPELDCANPQQARAALDAAEMVVAMSAFKHGFDYADVLLPIAPFSETSGTFVNCEGRAQSFNGTVKPLGETRPAWKVLRVLGNLLGLSGFDHNDSQDVLRDALGDTPVGSVQAFLNNEVGGVRVTPPQASKGLERVAEVPIYQTDAVVRRSPSLQRTLDAALPVARMHSRLIKALGLEENSRVSVRQTAGALTLKVQRDDLLPDNCVRIPSGHPLTAGLGPMFGAITAEPV
jgi:NADH-quinone oxidoreductase subunit G